MTEIVVVESAETVERAIELDNQIITSAQTLREAILEMYLTSAWVHLGHGSWESYLQSVSERTAASASYLRRVGHVAYLEYVTEEYPVGTFREGTLRPITEMLSDAKGFSEDDRKEALHIAMGQVDDTSDLTAEIAKAAASFVVVNTRTPDAGKRLVERMKSGELSLNTSNELCQIMRGTAAEGLEIFIAEMSDPELAEEVINLSRSNGETWNDLRETMYMTSTLPTRDDTQIPLSEARVSDLYGWLDEPQRLKRKEMAVEKEFLLKEIAKTAAKIMVFMYGDGDQESLSTASMDELQLYGLLVEAGYIRKTK